MQIKGEYFELSQPIEVIYISRILYFWPSDFNSQKEKLVHLRFPGTLCSLASRRNLRCLQKSKHKIIFLSFQLKCDVILLFTYEFYVPTNFTCVYSVLVTKAINHAESLARINSRCYIMNAI